MRWVQRRLLGVWDWYRNYAAYAIAGLIGAIVSISAYYLVTDFLGAHFVWDLTPATALGLVVFWPFAYLTHELLHVIPLAVTRSPVEIEFNPGDAPLWFNLTFGRTFEFRSEAPAGVAILSYLAPLSFAILALPLWYQVLESVQTQGYISITYAIFTASWFVVFLPSLSDWVNTYATLQAWRSADGP